MVTEFKVSGLGRKKSITCETPKEGIFWPRVDMEQDRFDALWDYFKGNSPMVMTAQIEHDGFFEDGTPKNPVVVAVYD